MGLSLDVRAERWPIAGAFTISARRQDRGRRGRRRSQRRRATGRGECVPYARYGETVEGVTAALEAMRDAAGGRARPAGVAARDAGGRRAQRARLRVVGSRGQGERQAGACARRTAGARTRWSPPTRSRSARRRRWPTAARKAAARKLLKIKLGGDGRCRSASRAVRAAAPNAELIVDANEAWRADNLGANLAACAEAGVTLVEQPLPAGDDAALALDRAADPGLRRRKRARPRVARRRSSAATTRSTSSSTRPAA